MAAIFTTSYLINSLVGVSLNGLKHDIIRKSFIKSFLGMLSPRSGHTDRTRGSNHRDNLIPQSNLETMLL